MEIIVDVLLAVLAIVAFALVFMIGDGYGQQRLRKAMGSVLMSQHIALNWAMQYVIPLDDEDIDRWDSDFDYAIAVAKGDIDALLFEK